MEEIWKDIFGYEGLYQVCSNGHIKRLYKDKRSKHFIVLKPFKNKSGHLQVHLCKSNHKKYLVHRLVLETFIGPCPPGMEACHNNGDKNNNCINNLRWDTRSNNQKDRRFHGTKSNPIWNFFKCGSKNLTAKLNEKQVRIIKWLLKNSNLSQECIAKIFDIRQCTISDIKNNKIWKHI